MFYEYDLTVPAGTPASAPTTALALLNKGHVTRVAVMFPAGSAGLVRTTCFRGAFQVWPSNPDGFFKGDDRVVEWEEDYALDDAPLTLTLRGWSPGARFEHTVTWRFEVVPLDRARAARETPGVLARIAAALAGRR